MNTEFDNKLSQIKDLTWLPFIGLNYFSNDVKTIIVAESHYYKPEDEKSYENHLIPFFTREVVEEMCFNREYFKIKLFTNFHRAMMGNDTFDSTKFWNDFAFYNFIQRPMNMDIWERPNYEDFDSGWNTFYKLIPILKPDRVLFLGNSSADRFNGSATRNEIKIEYVQRIKKIGSAYAKKAYMYHGDTKIQLDFIKHPSQYFSWDKWREYLLEIGLAK